MPIWAYSTSMGELKSMITGFRLRVHCDYEFIVKIAW
jgi:hypothetical protein